VDTTTFESLAETPDTFSVFHLAASKRDAMKFLPSEAQYLHLVDTTAPLSNWGTPSLTATMNIGKVSISSFLWCFTECGGPLGNITVRGYFGVFATQQTVVVSGYEKIQYDGRPRMWCGKTSIALIITKRARLFEVQREREALNDSDYLQDAR
jgi:hypothetical protein